MILIVMVFIIGYLAIMMEHSLRIDKAASALVTGIVCWTVYVFSTNNHETASEDLMHYFADISSILFFLLGAMTIVELIATHDGFRIITGRITSTSKLKLIWIIAILSFFLSAILDNLTTTIVMVTMCGRILSDKNDRLWFAGVVVIAANAGGAWSPLGDVTTTMLWIGNQISALNIIRVLIVPSVVVILLPLIILSIKFYGKKITPASSGQKMPYSYERNVIFFAGIGLLFFVPVFKTVTHLPPFMGMMLALGILWFITAFIHSKKPQEQREKLSIQYAIRHIDAPSILFFLGILLAVSALQSAGTLKELALFLDRILGDDYLIGTSLGLLSAIVDNVPLVAGAQGMYSLSDFPTDHSFWEFIALTTGTGGSIIIIGSAAGVAAMGIEEIRFMWYLRRIAPLAIIGYAGGILTFLLLM
jgi:Na+/H+ antiporter NhaD/arsenite permease-like protein